MTGAFKLAFFFALAFTCIIIQMTLYRDQVVVGTEPALGTLEIEVGIHAGWIICPLQCPVSTHTHSCPPFPLTLKAVYLLLLCCYGVLLEWEHNSQVESVIKLLSN